MFHPETFTCTLTGFQRLGKDYPSIIVFPFALPFSTVPQLPHLCGPTISMSQLSHPESSIFPNISDQDCASHTFMSTVNTFTPPAMVESSDYSKIVWDADANPCLPYEKGFSITAFRHQPSNPFGLGYRTQPPPEQDHWEEKSQVDYCLSRPPTVGRTNSSTAKPFLITSTIRTGLQRGAQIVVVNHTMVAKIYDPLYYPYMNECGTKNDVVSGADGDYGREVAAFEQLQHSSRAKSVTPAYFSSWTTMIETQVKRPHNKTQTILRPVRFILEELIHGDCMADINATTLRDEVRSITLKECIVAETLVYNAMVDHRDVCPRNIMIESSNFNNPLVSISDIRINVKLIDFNVSVVKSHTMFLGEGTVREEKWPSKLLSPIARYFGDMMEFSTNGWCFNKSMEAEIWLWQ